MFNIDKLASYDESEAVRVRCVRTAPKSLR